ncbi:hypothetical protein PK98_15755 [Croceibacterium mercuriale]|uniref:Uncharacterized protein n=1 Tax=Croceibacterium mercuriale TaxID=1572751 RepID=A0A0B2BVU0_9SPHN|nr:hypothetical protein [Croceibacterium mercuriale]KHL24094.1 hypothetical protein PK98_15755 [Croceibacterium mercuriale]
MPRFSHFADLDGAPSGERCAQVGRTSNFAAINRLEANIYVAALIATYGAPPAGVRVRVVSNHHDFGTYRTVALELDDSLTEEEATAALDYAQEAENGVERWLHAGFTPPIEYGPNGTTRLIASTVEDAVRGALQTTRPTPKGAFFPASSETLHTNLRAAWPEIDVPGAIAA